MKILYNPPVPNGAPIGRGYNNFIVSGAIIDSLLPGEVKQFEDNEAKEILDVFEFIREVTPEQANKLLEKPREASLKCDKCDFSTDTKIALISHQKKHTKEAQVAEMAKGVPVAKNNRLEQAPDGTPLAAVPTAGIQPPVSADPTADGVDKDGVEWYGGGKKESRSSMGPTTPFGKGRFGAQPLTD